MSNAPAGHWDGVYTAKAITEVSWYQTSPAYSLELLETAGAAPDEPVIDVGAGASVLVDHLLDRGHTDVTVLDVSADALLTAQDRLGPDRVAGVDWVVADLLTWQPARQYRTWHDRAVFHFLTGPADRDRYRAVLGRAIEPGGHVVIGTFAEDGPASCSGLPTARYSAEDLAAEFPGYRVVRTAREEHRTPSGAVQPFAWLLLAADDSRSPGPAGSTVTGTGRP